MKKAKEVKKVVFDWELGSDIVSLEVGSYAFGGGIYIEMISHGEDGPESFADVTTNIPGYRQDPNEAFINGDISKDLLKFIRKYKLGEVYPDKARSGYGEYSIVEFNLARLKEFDPKGGKKFMKLHGIDKSELAL